MVDERSSKVLEFVSVSRFWDESERQAYMFSSRVYFALMGTESNVVGARVREVH